MPSQRALAAELVPAVLALILAAPGSAVGQTAESRRTEALVHEAEEAMRAEDFPAAERLLQAAIAAFPQGPEAHCSLGQAYMALGRPAQAVESLRRCKALILAGLRRAQSEQARAYSRIEGEIRELRDSLRAIESGTVKSAGADRVVRLEARIRELEQEKARDPVRVEVPGAVTLALGTACLRAGLLEEAERELREAARVMPGNGDARRGLATVLAAQRRFGEASEEVAAAEASGIPVDPGLKADIAAERVPAGVAAAVLPPTAPGEEASAPPAIRHQARSCVGEGTFARIEADVDLAALVDSPVVRFRTDKAAGWYSTAMQPAGGDAYVTYLPRPRGAKQFEYFIQIGENDTEAARTDTVRVRVLERAECEEASSDPTETGSVLVVNAPPEASEEDPVPPGFSIRGTTADIGVLEMRPKKALLAGALGLGAAVAGAMALADEEPTPYPGPEPFVDGPGIAFVSSTPAPGSALSLSSGSLAVELRVFSPRTIPGARITGYLAVRGIGAHCTSISGVHDLEGGRTVSLVIGGPTHPDGTYCPHGGLLEELRVAVTESNGLGGFLTGSGGLPHLRVSYRIED